MAKKELFIPKSSLDLAIFQIMLTSLFASMAMGKTEAKDGSIRPREGYPKYESALSHHNDRVKNWQPGRGAR